MVRFIFITFLTLFISCTTVPVTSIPKLRKIDFSTSDISKTMIVLRYDEGVKFDPSRVKITFYLEETGVENPLRREYVTYLREDNRDAEARLLKATNQRDGAKFVSLSFSPEAAKTVTEYQQLGAKMKAEGRHGKGGFAIDVEELCLGQAAENANPRGDLWIRTEETGGFVLAMRNVDLTGKSYDKLSDADREKLYCTNE